MCISATVTYKHVSSGDAGEKDLQIPLPIEASKQDSHQARGAQMDHFEMYENYGEILNDCLDTVDKFFTN